VIILLFCVEYIFLLKITWDDKEATHCTNVTLGYACIKARYWREIYKYQTRAGTLMWSNCWFVKLWCTKWIYKSPTGKI